MEVQTNFRDPPYKVRCYDFVPRTPRYCCRALFIPLYIRLPSEFIVHSHGGLTVPMSCYRAKSEGAPSFSASSTALEVAEHANFTGKHAVVTGGNSGIGLETVRALYAAGAEGTLTLKTIDEPLWHRTQSRLQPFV